MKRLRTIVAVLIALAISVAPMGSASARTVAPASHAVQVTDALDMAAMDMTDCEKMMLKAAKGDCLCCDTNKACSPDLCPFKCFKMFSGIITRQVTPTLAAVLLHSGEPQRPPDWIDSPQPPPPRA